MYQLMKHPNFRDSFFDISESLSANIELSGNNYLLTDRVDEKAIPTAIYALRASIVNILMHEKVEAIRGIEDIIKGYEYGKYRKD